LDLNFGELRFIEVKGLAEATGTILLMPNERRVSENPRYCNWLYVVTHCSTNPVMREPIKDPARFPWQEVTNVDPLLNGSQRHYEADDGAGGLAAV
jgi:hypothetical protein